MVEVSDADMNACASNETESERNGDGEGQERLLESLASLTLGAGELVSDDGVDDDIVVSVRLHVDEKGANTATEPSTSSIDVHVALSVVHRGSNVQNEEEKEKDDEVMMGADIHDDEDDEDEEGQDEDQDEEESESEEETTGRSPRGKRRLVRFVMGRSVSSLSSSESVVSKPKGGSAVMEEVIEEDEEEEEEEEMMTAGNSGGSVALVPGIKSGSGVGIVYDPIMELHRAPGDPDGHVERPLRTITIMSKLSASTRRGGRGESILDRCRVLSSRRADDVELELAHTTAHIQSVHGQSSSVSENGVSFGDIYFNSNTEAAARTAAGCVIEACERVLDGTVRAALAVVRPPGHHAECAREMGFCFFNNVAVAALQLVTFHAHACRRVLIVDWDVHHGNGIQHILEEREDIMYVSLHRFTQYFYPGTGAAEEAGFGAGAGTTVNVPFDKIGCSDADYLAAFDLVIAPIVRQFAPDIVIVSAGFDAVKGDPLGGMTVSPGGYAHMTRRLAELSSYGRIVLALEGGYDVDLNAECITECMSALFDDSDYVLPDLGSRLRVKASTEDTLRHVAEIHAQYCAELRSEEWAAKANTAFSHLHIAAGQVKGGSSARKATPRKQTPATPSRATPRRSPRRKQQQQQQQQQQDQQQQKQTVRDADASIDAASASSCVNAPPPAYEAEATSTHAGD